jgi:pantetheine-phosphate adenylyltransferase
MRLNHHKFILRQSLCDLATRLTARNIFFAFVTLAITLRVMANHANGRKIGVFPGQFDPITNGHLDVIKRGMRLFDELIVAVGVNPDKTELFTLDERVEMIGELDQARHGRASREIRRTYGRICEARPSNGDPPRHSRRIRFEYEFQLALANRAVGGVETVLHHDRRPIRADQQQPDSTDHLAGWRRKGFGGGRFPSSVLPRLKEKQRVLRKTHRPGPDAPAT